MGKFKEMAISEELPYWEFVGEPKPHIILSDGSLSTGLKIEPIDVECFDTLSMNNMTTKIRTLLNSLVDNTKLQIVLSIDSDFTDFLEKHSSQRAKEIPTILDELSANRMSQIKEQIAEKTLYRPRLYAFLTRKQDEKSPLSFFKKEAEFVKLSGDNYRSTLEELFQQLDTLKSSIESIGLNAGILEVSDLIGVAYRFLNPSRSSIVSQPEVYSPTDIEVDEKALNESPWLALNSPRSQISFGDLVLNYENFILDGKAHRVITLKTLPEVTYSGMIAKLLRLPFHYDLVLNIYVPPQSSEMDKLKTKRRMAHSMASGPANQVSDIESESKLSSTEDLIRELINTGQKIFTFDLSFILKSDPSKEGLRLLDNYTRELLSRFKTLNGAEGLLESIAGWKIFKNNLPGAPKAQIRGKRVKTNNLADFLPLYGPRLGDAIPSVLFRNRLNGLVSYNPFDPNLPNYNCLVTGSAGAGKSFLNNFILLQEIAKGTRAFIIDIGGSYKKLTEALGGQHIDINLTDDYAINPFHIPDPAVEPSDQKIKSLLAVIETMVSEDDKTKLPKLDRVLLEKVILKTFEDQRKVGKIPILSDLSKNCLESKEPQLQNFSKMLFSWTGERPYGKLLDKQGSLKTDSPIIAFDLKGLSAYPDLQAVIILILTEFILSQIEKDRTTTKRILLDEAWQFLKSEASANFMEYCVRTLRKTGSGITFITQGVDEIVDSSIGAAIINNTATKFVMLQRGDSAVLRDVLKLNPQELALIESLGQKKGHYSEGFMIEGDHRQIIRVYPQPLEYWLSTSDARDNEFLRIKMKEKSLTLTDALREAAREVPFGVASSEKGKVS
jgi:type-IV secretion system protein TraC